MGDGLQHIKKRDLSPDWTAAKAQARGLHEGLGGVAKDLLNVVAEGLGEDRGAILHALDQFVRQSDASPARWGMGLLHTAYGREIKAERFVQPAINSAVGSVLSLAGCAPDNAEPVAGVPQEGPVVKGATTDTAGRVKIEDPSGTMIEVKVVDQNGVPIPNATVGYASDGEHFLAMGWKPGVYFPALLDGTISEFATYSGALMAYGEEHGAIEPFTTALLIIGLISLADTVYNYWQTTQEQPLQILEESATHQKVCMSVEFLKSEAELTAAIILLPVGAGFTGPWKLISALASASKPWTWGDLYLQFIKNHYNLPEAKGYLVRKVKDPVSLCTPPPGALTCVLSPGDTWWDPNKDKVPAYQFEGPCNPGENSIKETQPSDTIVCTGTELLCDDFVNDPSPKQWQYADSGIVQNGFLVADGVSILESFWITGYHPTVSFRSSVHNAAGVMFLLDASSGFELKFGMAENGQFAVTYLEGSANHWAQGDCESGNFLNKDFVLGLDFDNGDVSVAVGDQIVCSGWASGYGFNGVPSDMAAIKIAIDTIKAPTALDYILLK
ncbi:MAG: hypothetical protein HYV03_01570 [Deltaproteobacteria bacterium]|nr:hypothetical protein [Deltaproteobacteria bacterium]